MTVGRKTVRRTGATVGALALFGVGYAVGNLTSSSGSAGHPLAGGSHPVTPTSAAPSTSVTSPPSSAPSSTAAPATAPPTTVPLPLLVIPAVSGLVGYSGRYPRTVDFSGDAGNIVSRITWIQWGPSQAVGYGTWTYQDCVPDCASGSQTPYPATITLSQSAGGRYTKLVETTAGPHGFTTVDYLGSNAWPEGAT